VEYLNHSTPASAFAGQTRGVQISLVNSSGRTWLAGGQHPFRLGYHWYTADGHEVPASLWDDNRTGLPYDLPPGASVTLNCDLSIPRLPGHYEVRWDMVEEQRTWFAWQGVPTLNVEVNVSGVDVERPPYPLIVINASHNDQRTGPDNLLQALDHDPATRWSTRHPQRRGMWFQIDLNETRPVSGLALDSTGSPEDYPRGYRVFVAEDRDHWLEVASNAQNDRPLNVTFSPRPVRYIYIEQTGDDPTYWWSIHGIEIHGPVLITARASHNNTQIGVDNVAQALDGRPDTRWSSQTPQQPGMWFELDLHETRPVSGLALDSTGSPHDYPRGYRVFVAEDRDHWLEVASNAQNDRPLNVNFSPRPVRYIYIEQTGQSDDWWWSIHGVTIRG
jgi:hypothetical protein